MEVIFTAYMVIAFAAMLILLRAAWHFGTTIKLENECDVKQHELNVLKLKIELERAKHPQPQQETTPCVSVARYSSSESSASGPSASSPPSDTPPS